MGENSVSGGRQDNLVQAETIHSLSIGTAAEKTEKLPRYLQDPARWPLVSGWEALKAGAHKARPGEGGGKVPPYVTRDVDEALRERVADGGLILVVGDSTAGKTRAAFEAVRAVLPGHRVLAPPVGASLVPAPDAVERAGSPCVVWLDDLERYLGPDGLEPDVLDDFVRLHVPVVATMRLKPYETFSTDRDSGVGSQVLRLAEVVDLDRLWSERELARAEECDDSRIVDAVAHHGPATADAFLQECPPGHRSRAGTGMRGGAEATRTAVRLGTEGAEDVVLPRPLADDQPTRRGSTGLRCGREFVQRSHSAAASARPRASRTPISRSRWLCLSDSNTFSASATSGSAGASGGGWGVFFSCSSSSGGRPPTIRSAGSPTVGSCALGGVCGGSPSRSRFASSPVRATFATSWSVAHRPPPPCQRHSCK
jgi:hypothetical protein